MDLLRAVLQTQDRVTCVAAIGTMQAIFYDGVGGDGRAGTATGSIIIVSVLVAMGLLVSGAYYFRRMEKTFADVV